MGWRRAGWYRLRQHRKVLWKPPNGVGSRLHRPPLFPWPLIPARGKHAFKDLRRIVRPIVVGQRLRLLRPLPVARRLLSLWHRMLCITGPAVGLSGPFDLLRQFVESRGDA